MSFSSAHHSEYLKLCEDAIRSPVEMWSNIAKSSLDWISSDFTNVIGEIGEGNSFWFDGGVINVCYNAVDRHALANPDKIAMIYEGNNLGERKTMTFMELKNHVSRMANVLLSKGVKKGTLVAIYLPVCFEAVISMLACARIGAIHSVIFGAFCGDALCFRISDCKAEVVITANGFYRANKRIQMKKNLDIVIDSCTSVKHVIVAKLLEDEFPEFTARDEWLHELMENASYDCPCEQMKSSDPLFILYTSGSTGNPKGIIHRCGGYALATFLTFKYVFDVVPGDIFGCTSDLGWITGHSYVCYGPLLNGCTTLIFGGSPLFPDSTRSWQLIEQLSLTHFYTSPSAARAISAKIGTVEKIQHFDISNLRVIGSVGETLDEETWKYLHNVVGRGKCWIVDTYWQTELGSIIATNVPGSVDQKPGIVGRPLFGTEIVLIDHDNHRIVASTRASPPQENLTGLLCISSPWPSLANASFGMSSSFKDKYIVPGTSFFSTGDTATIDKDGDIRITGRIDDQLCVNGHRVGPAEVEGAIMKLHDVKDAAVVGVPSKISAQSIVAFVVSLNESEEMRAQVMKVVTDNFGAIGRPHKIYFVKALPKTNSAKIIRLMLKNMLLGKKVPYPATLNNPQDIPDIESIIAADPIH